MDELQNGVARLVKPGSGKAVEKGMMVRLHLRSARRPEDFEDDRKVLASSLRDGHPYITHLSEDELLPEVYRGLVGQQIGSTILIRLERRPDLPHRAMYLEVWIDDAGEHLENEIELIASRVIASDAPALKRTDISWIQDVVSSVKSQRNGLVMQVRKENESEFMSYGEEISSRCGCPAPHCMDRYSSDLRSSYLVSPIFLKEFTSLIGAKP